MTKTNRLFFITIILTVVTVFAACGIIENDEYISGELNNSYEFQIEAMRAEFLEDLDYMQRLLEENFASFDVVYWARGVDISAMFDAAREEILIAEHLDLNTFGNILTERFLGLNNIAHFFIDVNLGASEHTITMVGYLTEKYRNERYFNATSVGLMAIYEEVLKSEFWSGDEYRLVRLLSTSFHPEIAGEMVEILMSSGADAALERYFVWLNETNYSHITTEIIEDERIKYIGIRSFMDAIEYEDILNDLFNDIQDFEHLIIDLRGNPGGISAVFDHFIIAPLISEPLTAEGFVFLSHGEYVNIPTLQSTTSSMRYLANIELIDRAWTPINEVLANWDIPNLNINDMARMDYANRIYKEIQPRLLSQFDYQPAFNGKIWILVDEFVRSGAQIVAWFAYETGFATLVGGTTGGNYSGTRTNVALPNTRVRVTFAMLYLTDTNGRPLEAGTVPHYFNRQGMDALQTVLAMIEEGKH